MLTVRGMLILICSCDALIYKSPVPFHCTWSTPCHELWYKGPLILALPIFISYSALQPASAVPLQFECPRVMHSLYRPLGCSFPSSPNGLGLHVWPSVSVLHKMGCPLGPFSLRPVTGCFMTGYHLSLVYYLAHFILVPIRMWAPRGQSLRLYPLQLDLQCLS